MKTKNKTLPNGWIEERLENILNIKYGKDYKHLKTGEIPMFGSGGIVKYVSDYIYDKKSILIPRKGTLKNILYLEKPFWAIDTMFYSEINEKEIFWQIFIL